MGMHFWKRKGWKDLEDLMLFLDQVPSPTEAIELDDFHCDFFSNARKVLARMVKSEPEERYESVEDILRDLSEAPPRSAPSSAGPRSPLSELLPISARIDLDSPLLIVESGSNRLARTVLGLRDGERCELGRSDLAGSDASISRRQLKISRKGNRYYVCDLGSKNGTMLRGITLKRGSSEVEIRHDDHIKVGDIFLRFAFLTKAAG